MANVGGRQLTLGATKHNKIIDPVLQNGTFLQDPGLEPSDLALSGLQTVPETKWQSWRILGQVPYLGVPYSGTGHCTCFRRVVRPRTTMRSLSRQELLRSA